jgi:hypothetical protein
MGCTCGYWRYNKRAGTKVPLFFALIFFSTQECSRFIKQQILLIHFRFVIHFSICLRENKRSAPGKRRPFLAALE